MRPIPRPNKNVFARRFSPALPATLLLVWATLLFFATPPRSLFAQADAPSPDSIESLQSQLRLKGNPEPMAPKFIDRVPAAISGSEEQRLDFFLYQDVPTSSPLANLSLADCIRLTLENNVTLHKGRRDVNAADSRLRESESFFIPFVNLIGDATYTESRANVTDPVTGETELRRVTANHQDGRAEVTQNFTSGGNLTVGAGTTRDRGVPGPDGGTVAYDNEADARFNQPILRGAGFEVGTADLRLARLAQMQSDLSYRLQERDTVLRVVLQYFLLLQAAQELRVSRDALAEKLRFLEETRIKFQKGRVAESEILRAEIQYLQEQENAVTSRQSFNDRRENLALAMGLDPTTPLSVIDISDILAQRGRYEIPGVTESLTIGLNSRLELLQSEITYEQARVNLQVARNNVLPDLNFTTGYTTNDVDKTLGGATNFENNTWDAGLELRIPLPNIARKEQRYRAELTVQNVQSDWDQRERDISEEILTAHRAVQSSESSLAILAKTVEQARKNLELINGSFEVGYSTITDVRLAQDDLFQAQTNYNNTLLSYQTAIARYYVAVGQDLY